MCEWRSRQKPEYVCRQSAEPGSQFCILHEPREKDEGKFAQALSNQTDQVGNESERNRQYDFRGYVFPHGFAIRTPGRMQAAGAYALVCDDRPLLNFSEAVIKGDLNASSVHLAGLAMVGAVVEGIALFLWATVEGRADMTGCRFARGASFQGASFTGDLHLDGTRFEGRSYFEGCTVRNLKLGAGKPTILPLVKRREGVQLTEKSGWSFWDFASRHYRSKGLPEQADTAQFFERKWRFRAQIARGGARKLFALATYPLEFVFLRLMSAYGASLARLFTSWAVLIGGFAVSYYTLLLRGVQLFASESPGLAFPFSFGRALYFSIITFTTLGYGDIQPAPGVGSALCAAEAILGGITMALTVLVIGRKFMR
jgi:hypothetical protein